MTGLKTTQTIAFLIMPGFPMACLTSAIEPLRAANEIFGSKVFKWRILSESGSAVRSSADVNFEPDERLGDMSAADALFILSPPLTEFTEPSKTKAILHRLGRTNMTLGAFSGGVFPLCESGVMARYTPSVHWVYESAFASKFPDQPTTDKVINIEERRETASGAAAVFDMILMRIQDVLGHDIMNEVACWFQHPFLQDEDMRQRVPERLGGQRNEYLPAVVAAALEEFQRVEDEPIRIGKLSKKLGVSSRQLLREFQRSLGRSPRQYLNQMRLDRARQQVRYSNTPLDLIAQSVGYLNSSAFVKAYKSAFKVTPSEERKAINRARVEENNAVPAS